jgi:hypothetical protein
MKTRGVPALVRYIDDTLGKIRRAGQHYGFPMKVAKVVPTLADDTSDREVLRDSICNLLGLTVYGRLQDDLSSRRTANGTNNFKRSCGSYWKRTRS